eukprot:symbB.v1.2.014938.t1/scaffold1102.1/size137770/4
MDRGCWLYALRLAACCMFPEECFRLDPELPQVLQCTDSELATCIMWEVNWMFLDFAAPLIGFQADLHMSQGLQIEFMCDETCAICIDLP